MEVKQEEIDPQFLHGFTVEQLEKDPRGCLLSGNLQRMHDARSALNAKYLMLNGGTREELAADRTPMWQKLSGLTPQNERSARPREREEMIFSLLKAAERLIRGELQDEAKRQREGTSVLTRGRSQSWDPVRAVCFHLEISQRKLSLYAREAMGISAYEMADAVRAEGVRARMKAELKRFVDEFLASPHPRPLSQMGRVGNGELGGSNERLADGIWEALKRSRRGPCFHRTSWALSFGFSSYTRFFRACLNCYGMTPHELEFALIEEILGEAESDGENGNGNGYGNGGHEGHEEETERTRRMDGLRADVVKRE